MDRLVQDSTVAVGYKVAVVLDPDPHKSYISFINRHMPLERSLLCARDSQGHWHPTLTNDATARSVVNNLEEVYIRQFFDHQVAHLVIMLAQCQLLMTAYSDISYSYMIIDEAHVATYGLNVEELEWLQDGVLQNSCKHSPPAKR